MRLDRLLANSGFGTRTEAVRAIRSGRVAVAGSVVRDPARHAGAAEVTVEGAPLDHPDGVVVGLHKPVGYVCSHTEEEGPTIYDLLPGGWGLRRPRPESAGRLDRESSGLLIVTDDHQLLHRLTSPKHLVAKTYVATLAEPLTDDVIDRFGSGELVLRGESDPCRPATVTRLDTNVAEVQLAEGRYHQVRRMFAACGNHVESLHRTRVGDWDLAGLEPGQWRDLDPAP